MTANDPATQPSERHDGSATTPTQQGIKGILHPELQTDQPPDANQKPADDDDTTAQPSAESDQHPN
jgi:hypothetical protein